MKCKILLQHYAARHGRIEICRLLLDAGADVNVQTSSGRATALHRAAYSGHCDVVRLLLQRGADPLLIDADGQTVLHKVGELNDDLQYSFLT